MRTMVPVCALLFSLVTGIRSENPPKMSDAMGEHLHGPVHTQKLVAKKLPEFSAFAPKTYFWSPAPWMVFDANGDLIEKAYSLSANGSPGVISRPLKDMNGWIVGYETVGPAVKSTSRTESVQGQHGPVEIRSYVNGVLESIQKITYGPSGTKSEELYCDAAGKILSQVRYTDRDRVKETEVRGYDGQFQLHTIHTFDSDGELMSLEFLDAKGKMVMSIAFRGGQLLSVWRDPECRGVGLSSALSSGDISTEYFVEDCRVETVVGRHPGRKWGLENDELERFDETGRSLEKLTFLYDRDHYGNWTRRIVSVWDASTNTLVPIEEDTRTITYYH